MSKNNTAYHKVIHQNRVHLNLIERTASKLIHQKIVEVVLASLERTFFRIIPMQFGFIAVTTIGLFIVVVAYFYGYQTAGLTVLAYVFALGFIVGVVYEYVKTLIKQVK